MIGIKHTNVELGGKPMDEMPALKEITKFSNPYDLYKAPEAG